MTCTFGPIVDNDIEALTQIWNDGYQQGHAGNVPDTLMVLRTAASFRDRLIAHSDPAIVAYIDDTPVGFCLIRANEVYQFYVGKSAQGTGAARDLMTQSLHQIHKYGHTSARLAVTPGNDRAMAFYTKMGFVNSGLQKETVETSEGPYVMDCFIMVKKLI